MRLRRLLSNSANSESMSSGSSPRVAVRLSLSSTVEVKSTSSGVASCDLLNSLPSLDINRERNSFRFDALSIGFSVGGGCAREAAVEVLTESLPAPPSPPLLLAHSCLLMLAIVRDSLSEVTSSQSMVNLELDTSRTGVRWTGCVATGVLIRISCSCALIIKKMRDDFPTPPGPNIKNTSSW